MKTFLLAFVSTALAVSSFAATVSDVSARQQWPWSKKVTIDYSLAADEPVDIALQVTVGGVTREISQSALSGDLLAKTSGKWKLVWDPTVDYPSDQILVTPKVTVVPVTERKYMIVELAHDLGLTASRISYTNAVIGLGVDAAGNRAWDDYYKTNALVLRRVLPCTFAMGSPSTEKGRNAAEVQHQVTLTRPYYIGVFPVTQSQYVLMRYADKYNPSFFTNRTYWATRPVDQIKYGDIRGATWPTSKTDLGKTDGVLYQLRRMTGDVLPFDFPTEAQWECACRAGSTSALYTGDELASGTASQDDVVDAIAWYASNSGGYTSNAAYRNAGIEEGGMGTKPVGMFKPNAWGLYDMVGNMFEWCVDWSNAYSAEAVTDPDGGADSGNRVRRGGARLASPATCRSAARNATTIYDGGNYMGMRVAVTIY